MSKKRHTASYKTRHKEQNMTDLQTICNKPNPTALELHRAISADARISDQIIRMSSGITKDADSPSKAILILGVNTVKNIALMVV